MPARRQSPVHQHWLVNVVLIVPLMVFYQVGVLFCDTMNGADLITQALLEQVGARWYLGIQLALVCVAIGLWLFFRRKNRWSVRQLIVPMLLESSIYALTMGTLIVFLMDSVLQVNPGLSTASINTTTSAPLDVWWQRLVMSIGAGVHEELLFRQIGFAGLRRLGERALGYKKHTPQKHIPWIAAMLISAALFAWAHHWGALGESFTLSVFVYRLLAGIFFAALYHFRGLAVAVYSHALYDIYVLMWR